MARTGQEILRAQLASMGVDVAELGALHGEAR